MRHHWRQCNGHGCARRMGQFLDPALLLLLAQQPAHGYTLLSRLAEFGLDFLAPTVVYRALREMEAWGWISSTRDEEETQGPPRRVYALTPTGRAVLHCCMAQLRNARQILDYFQILYDELSTTAPASLPSESVQEETRMWVVIPANGVDLEAPVSPVFGRCQTFLFVDPGTLLFEALPNPAQQATGGAGVQTMQVILQHGVHAVIAPQLGPNAFRLVQAAGVPAYRLTGTTVREVVAAFNAGQLARLEAPSAAGHQAMD